MSKIVSSTPLEKRAAASTAYTTKTKTHSIPYKHNLLAYRQVQTLTANVTIWSHISQQTPPPNHQTHRTIRMQQKNRKYSQTQQEGLTGAAGEETLSFIHSSFSLTHSLAPSPHRNPLPADRSTDERTDQQSQPYIFLPLLSLFSLSSR